MPFPPTARNVPPESASDCRPTRRRTTGPSPDLKPVVPAARDAAPTAGGRGRGGARQPHLRPAAVRADAPQRAGRAASRGSGCVAVLVLGGGATQNQKDERLFSLRSGPSGVPHPHPSDYFPRRPKGEWWIVCHISGNSSQ